MDAPHLLLHPVRQRIVHAVLDRQPFTAHDLTRRLPDVSAATIYRQLAALIDGGLIQVVAERRIRGAVQRTLQLTRRSPLLSDADVSELSPEEIRALAATFGIALTAELVRYLSQPGPDVEAVSMRQSVLCLDDDDRDQLARRLQSVITDYADLPPRPGRRNHIVSTVMFPLQAEPDDRT